jgi:CPA2 family monovalent cation:H+ antiporter-2
VCIVGGAAWVSHANQLSPALGAFVAGMLLAVSPFATQIQADIQPLRAVLVTLFFAAIGMYGDVGWFVSNLGLVAALALVIVIGKGLIVVMVTRHSRFPLQFSVAAGLCLAQIGEFSFVLATIARSGTDGKGLLSENTFRALVSATIVSLLLTPYLVAAAPRVGGWAERVWRRMRRRPAQEPRKPQEPLEAEVPVAAADAILIIGFGPAGQRVAEELLADYEPYITVIDLNPHNLQIARTYGLRSQIGDAMQTDVLEHAGIHRANIAVITIPNPAETLRVIQHIRQLAPSVRILVRSRYHIHHWGLLQAGADVAVDEESQVGQRLAHEARTMLQRPPTRPAAPPPRDD